MINFFNGNDLNGFLMYFSKSDILTTTVIFPLLTQGKRSDG